MSYRDFYPPGAADDPNAPYNLPEPIEDTDAFADKREEMTSERIKDDGPFDSVMEAAADFWTGLSTLLLVSGSDDIDRLIGAYIRRMVISYCTPSDSEVIEELEAENE